MQPADATGIVEEMRERARRAAALNLAHASRILGMSSAPLWENTPRSHTIHANAETGDRTIVREVVDLTKTRDALKAEVAALSEEKGDLLKEVEQLRLDHGVFAPRPKSIRGVTNAYIDGLAVVGVILEGHDVGLGHLRSARRAKRWAQIRQVGMALCRDLVPEASFPQIAGYYHRDHTTAMHAGRMAPKVVRECRDLHAAALLTCAQLCVDTPDWLAFEEKGGPA